jgi:hypothetical protein
VNADDRASYVLLLPLSNISALVLYPALPTLPTITAPVLSPTASHALPLPYTSTSLQLHFPSPSLCQCSTPVLLCLAACPNQVPPYYRGFFSAFSPAFAWSALMKVPRLAGQMCDIPINHPFCYFTLFNAYSPGCPKCCRVRLPFVHHVAGCLSYLLKWCNLEGLVHVHT